MLTAFVWDVGCYSGALVAVVIGRGLNTMPSSFADIRAERVARRVQTEERGNDASRASGSSVLHTL